MAYTAAVLAWANYYRGIIDHTHCLGPLRSYRRHPTTHSSEEEKGKFMGHRHSTPSYPCRDGPLLVAPLGGEGGWLMVLVSSLALRLRTPYMLRTLAWPCLTIVGSIDSQNVPCTHLVAWPRRHWQITTPYRRWGIKFTIYPVRQHSTNIRLYESLSRSVTTINHKHHVGRRQIILSKAAWLVRLSAPGWFPCIGRSRVAHVSERMLQYGVRSTEYDGMQHIAHYY